VRVVGYLRVSTDRQAEKGLGLDVQKQAIREWAKSHSHRVVAYLADEGVSGSNGIENRDALPQALGMVKSGAAQGVVVYRLDRLARDLVLQETLLAEIQRMGGQLFSTSPAESDYLTDDAADPSRTMIRQILGAVSQYERAMVRLRLSAGRRRKAEIGGYAFGSPRYGVKAEAGVLVEDPDEAAAVARIRELRAEGCSLREIAAVLTSEGFKPKRSAVWHPESLRRIVARLDV
jgi:DNA invertase Pin-like site-specific DNA recombinase